MPFQHATMLPKVRGHLADCKASPGQGRAWVDTYTVSPGETLHLRLRVAPRRF
jgi:hypothetical protein